MGQYSSWVSITLFSYACLVTPLHAAVVTVHFVNPQEFAEIGYPDTSAKETLGEIQNFIVGLGQRELPPSQVLTVDVVDLTLAGVNRPARGRTSDLRILKGSADPPRISLRYLLTDGGNVVASGKAELVDLAYLDHPKRSGAPDRFPYEKRMLSDWFYATFASNALSGR